MRENRMGLERKYILYYTFAGEKKKEKKNFRREEDAQWGERVVLAVSIGKKCGIFHKSRYRPSRVFYINKKEMNL